MLRADICTQRTVYEMDDNVSNKDRTARIGNKSGREVVAFEEAVGEEAELVAKPVTEGEVEAAAEEVGIDDVVNRDENELEEEVAGFVADDVVNGGSEVSRELPTMIVVPTVSAEVWVSVAGIAMVEVAAARGDEKEPDIPLRVKNDENAVYFVEFTVALVDVKAI